MVATGPVHRPFRLWLWEREPQTGTELPGEGQHVHANTHTVDSPVPCPPLAPHPDLSTASCWGHRHCLITSSAN